MSEPAQEWFTIPELAKLALPDMPATSANIVALANREHWRRAEWAGRRWRRRDGRGGGFEYHWSLLPPRARLMWATAHHLVDEIGESEASLAAGGDRIAWDNFRQLSERQRRRAEQKLLALDQIEALVASGRPRTVAVAEVAAAYEKSVSTVYGWAKAVEGVPRCHWLPMLADGYKGRVATSEFSEEAWNAFYIEYFRPSRPTLKYCYRKLEKVAAANGWVLPSYATVLRRVQSVDPTQAALARGGDRALKRMLPPQDRDKSVLRALEAVNADGHRFDVRVMFEDGRIDRPMVVAFQDIYSGKILSYRVARTESTDLIRLAFGDMIENFGIPESCYLDNGRAFASKQMTGGAAHRFRFTAKDADADGIMIRLGVCVHFTTPYSGQSKPVERSFNDFARDISRDIRFEGCHVGANPLDKPANYDPAHCVSMDVFRQVLDEGVAEHNARTGRRSPVCEGRYSFDQVFERSYGTSVIRKVTPEQKWLWLPQENDLQVRRPYGFIEFKKNKYQAHFLLGLMDKRVNVRFDPDFLHDGLFVFEAGGEFLGHVACVEKVGFNSAEEARVVAKRKANIRKTARLLDAADRKLSEDEHLRLTAQMTVPAPAPETRVIRPVFGNTALKPRPVEDADANNRFFQNWAQSVDREREDFERRHPHLSLITASGADD